jgi:HPt (histidine-containing phosphotransfer) domain-containing protein
MSALHKTLPRLKFQHIVSGFTEELEELYYDDFFRISLPIVRIALLLGIALYSVFGILDIWIVPIHRNSVWFIRYALVCPVLTAVLLLTFSGLFKKYMQLILSFSGLLAGVGIVAMIGVSAESEPGFKYYYAGLMLVLMWIYTLVRLRFKYATTISLIITISYEINAIWINRLLDTPDNAMVFLNNNFFFIGANIIGMFASFTIEWYMRKNFLLREEIKKAYNLNRKYLTTIKEGLLLIDENYIIMDQYSEYLTDMFERDDIQDESFIDLIYTAKDSSPEEKKELERFLSFLFHNKTADLEMIMDLNPFRNKKILIRKNGSVTKEIIVNADFIRINDNDSVEFVMVIFEDITEIVNFEKQLLEQKTKYQQEVESISAIIRSGPSLFINFLDESGVILNEISSNIRNLNDTKKLNHVFRQAHSLKGSSKHLELNHISAISHKIEDILIDVRDNPEDLPPNYITLIEELIADLLNEFENLNVMIDKLKGFSTIRNVSTSLEKKNFLDEFLHSLPAMAESIAKDLDKNVILEIQNELDEIPFLSKIKNPLIHMLRNCIDHGIEDQFERLTKGKDISGKIILKLYKTDLYYNIEIKDDGSGVNFENVRKKAIDKKLIDENDITVSRSDLLKLIFTPGFSSKGKVTELSGRGYGLDIVKDAAEQLNGKVIFNTKADQGTRIRLAIPF